MMFRAVAMFSLLSVGAPLCAQSTSAPPPAPPAADKMICVRHDETGSRLGSTRECHTRAEWDTINREAARAIEDSRMASRSGNNPK